MVGRAGGVGGPRRPLTRGTSTDATGRRSPGGRRIRDGPSAGALRGAGSIFAGTVAGTFDARKARISVPAGFRSALATLGSAEFVARKSDHSPCIEMWPKSVFEAEVQRRIADLDPFARDFERQTRRLVAHVHPLAPDSEGRLVMPREQIEKAELGGEVVFTGRYKFFQIWNAERWRAAEAAEAAADDAEGGAA